MLVGITFSDGIIDLEQYNATSFESMYQEHGANYRDVPIEKANGKVGRAYMTYTEERNGYVFTPGKSPEEAWAEVVKFHPYMEAKEQ